MSDSEDAGSASSSHSSSESDAQGGGLFGGCEDSDSSRSESSEEQRGVSLPEERVQALAHEAALYRDVIEQRDEDLPLPRDEKEVQALERMEDLTEGGRRVFACFSNDTLLDSVPFGLLGTVQLLLKRSMLCRVCGALLLDPVTFEGCAHTVCRGCAVMQAVGEASAGASECGELRSADSADGAASVASRGADESSAGGAAGAAGGKPAGKPADEHDSKPVGKSAGKPASSAPAFPSGQTFPSLSEAQKQKVADLARLFSREMRSEEPSGAPSAVKLARSEEEHVCPLCKVSGHVYAVPALRRITQAFRWGSPSEVLGEDEEEARERREEEAGKENAAGGGADDAQAAEGERRGAGAAAEPTKAPVSAEGDGGADPPAVKRLPEDSAHDPARPSSDLSRKSAVAAGAVAIESGEIAEAAEAPAAQAATAAAAATSAAPDSLERCCACGTRLAPFEEVKPRSKDRRSRSGDREARAGPRSELFTPKPSELEHHCLICDRVFCGLGPACSRLFRPLVRWEPEDVAQYCVDPDSLFGNAVELDLLREATLSRVPGLLETPGAAPLLAHFYSAFRAELKESYFVPILPAPEALTCIDAHHGCCVRCLQLVAEVACLYGRGKLSPLSLSGKYAGRPRCLCGVGCLQQLYDRRHAEEFEHAGVGSRGDQSHTLYP